MLEAIQYDDMAVVELLTTGVKVEKINLTPDPLNSPLKGLFPFSTPYLKFKVSSDSGGPASLRGIALTYCIVRLGYPVNIAGWVLPESLRGIVLTMCPQCLPISWHTY